MIMIATIRLYITKAAIFYQIAMLVARTLNIIDNPPKIFWSVFTSSGINVDQVCRSCYYQLRQLRDFARSLTFNAAVSLVHAFVFSRLDYCSSIFVGLPGVRMEKLRRVHRAAARLNGGFRKFDHISHYMRDVLHWLPFPQRIFYRIASLVWRCLSGW